ncbi:hypothetical protein HYC85_000071 [Camellia sinensis]|uniref:Uncharacterized protein n=1 Tax=Camellia sinensis TaxID=4442 RepID=A0A7J7FSG4_CAMSI|nr:hypothetical protein HYC85_000071 [Camellia sinensis]
MEKQTNFGCGSVVNSGRETKLEEDEEDFRSCCEDEDELMEREESAKESSKDILDEGSVNMLFKDLTLLHRNPTLLLSSSGTLFHAETPPDFSTPLPPFPNRIRFPTMAAIPSSIGGDFGFSIGRNRTMGLWVCRNLMNGRTGKRVLCLVGPKPINRKREERERKKERKKEEEKKKKKRKTKDSPKRRLCPRKVAPRIWIPLFTRLQPRHTLVMIYIMILLLSEFFLLTDVFQTPPLHPSSSTPASQSAAIRLYRIYIPHRHSRRHPL